MTGEGCLTFGELADYWTADLTPEEEQRIEAHVFACAACARLLDDSERLRARIGALTQAGDVRAFITDDVLNALSRDGVRVRSYALGPGDAVHCAVWSDDELVVARLRGNFAGVHAVSAEWRLDTGEVWGPAEDVPVRDGAAELMLALPAAMVRSAPETPIRLTLRRSDDPSGAVLAEYVFDHRGAHQRH